MAQVVFSDEFIKPFLNNFRKKYIYKQKFINNYENLISLNILNEISGYVLRPDVDMVQDLISRGASIILNEI